MSTAFHPLSDGQTEAVNKVITMYLRCMTGDRPRQWLQWLPWAKFIYNSAFQSSLRTSPFRVVYGRNPPPVPPYTAGTARAAAVDQLLWERDEFLAEVRDRLEQAQQQYKAAYDKHHRAVEFAVGSWVWLRLLHRPVASLDTKGRGKLGPRFYGPFRILERVGSVAYKLELPTNARLHNVFHVGLLKPYHGTTPSGPGVLPPTRHGRACPQPAKIIKGRLAWGIQELLTRWDGRPVVEATWVELSAFKQAFPTFQLEDALVLDGGRDVLTGVPYLHRRRRGAAATDVDGAAGPATHTEA
jgi:hypothetical protein